MEWVILSIGFLAAMSFLAWNHGIRYAVGIAVFLILSALIYTLVERHYGEQGALVFSLIALALGFGTTWLIRRKSKK